MADKSLLSVSKQPARGLVQSDYSSFITLKVGKEQQMLLLYEDVATKVSDYFATALRGDWEEAKSRTFTFDEYHPFLFKQFIKWSLSGTLDDTQGAPMGFLNYLDEAVNAAGADYPAPKDDKDMWEASLRPDAANLVALYLVGDLLQSRTFKNACLDKLISLCVNTDAVPWPATVRYAYASTPAGSKLRTFLTHLIHYSGGPHHRTANLNRAQDPDFVLDLAQIANLSKVVQSLPVPYSMGERDICDAYHEHTLYERCYNTGKPAQASSSQAGDSTARPSTSKPSQAGSAYQQTSRTQASATVTPPSGNSPARSQTQGTSSTPGFITSPGGTTWQHTYTRRVGRPPASTSGTSGASSQTSPTSQPLFNLFPNPSPYTQFPRANGGREERLNPMRAKLGESRKRNWGG